MYSTTVSALTEHMAIISLKEPLEGDFFIVEPIPGLAETYFLTVAALLDHGQRNVLQCRIINPTAHDIHIPENMPIAVISVLPEGSTIFQWDELEEQPPHEQPAMNNLNTGPKEGDLMHLTQVQGEPEEEYGLMTFPMQPKPEEERPY